MLALPLQICSPTPGEMDEIGENEPEAHRPAVVGFNEPTAGIDQQSDLASEQNAGSGVSDDASAGPGAGSGDLTGGGIDRRGGTDTGPGDQTGGGIDRRGGTDTGPGDRTGGGIDRRGG